ncbi:hypothetical protein [Teredinibacter sp. KSP-S5-2]|uniref:hypothetical protein n=1 Tax=Teredinibacter sp. KSP-S5-2 TaxID=3034506 RepID=UPI0029351155|nr:hypothetical protein [Teredinibacter sp. KSP-S5-2]WNO11431.1 hypothetical protein P5V12_09635 [Teredinibacter sp. KSP-S5-2]
MNRIFLILILLCIYHVDAHAKSSFNFDEASQGKRVIIVGDPLTGDIKGSNWKQTLLFDLCNDPEKTNCSSKYDQFRGLRGFFHSMTPEPTKGKYNIYRITFENGKTYGYRYYSVEASDPIESSSYFIDYDKYLEANKRVGTALGNNISIEYKSLITYGKILAYTLSNGETLTKDDIDARISFIKKHVKKEHTNAFLAFNQLDLKHDESQDKYWVSNKLRDKDSDLSKFHPIMVYISVKDEDKQMRIKFNFSGDSWVSFNDVTVISDQFRYEKQGVYGDVKRYSNRNNIYESLDLPVLGKEKSLIDALLTYAGGTVRFAGKDRQAEKDIPPEALERVQFIVDFYQWL